MRSYVPPPAGVLLTAS